MLTMAVGAFGIDYIVRNIGRSRSAVNHKIHEQFGGGISRGTISLIGTSERTGYTDRQLIRAGRALGQRWQRTSSVGRCMLSDDQVEALVRWLGHDYWCRATKLYACVYCGLATKPPKGMGLCSSCYATLSWRFGDAGLAFGVKGLLSLVRALRERTEPEACDWLDAFEASLEEGCVLTRGAIDRLFCETTTPEEQTT
jgi:hypothetical protein